MKTGTVVATCSDSTQECIDFVRDWCRLQGYTADDVKIVKRNGMVMAEAKRDLHGTVRS